MAAQQAAAMYTEAKIIVVPSKNIGMGYVALSSADLDSDDPCSILTEMTEAMSAVTTGFISPSIRDADLNGIHVNNGDTIGIIDKEIIVALPDRNDAAVALVERIFANGQKSMLTVFTGIDISEDEGEALKTVLSEKYPDLEIYYINGKQEIYAYIFVAE